MATPAYLTDVSGCFFWTGRRDGSSFDPMNKTFLFVLSVSLGLLPLSSSNAQQKGRVSPHETVKAAIDGSDMTIAYGRPYTKDPKSGEKRKIWGTLVPFDKVWRLGADEATTLTTSKSLDIGGKTIPAGTYTLFLLPHNESSATLIVNKQTGQWGTKYDEKQDLARVEMKGAAAGTAADQLTIAIDQASGGGGTLRVTWEAVQYSVDFKAGK